MFTGDWKESSAKSVIKSRHYVVLAILMVCADNILTCRKIDIEGFSFEVFKAFIVYLYTDEVHIDIDYVAGEMCTSMCISFNLHCMCTCACVCVCVCVCVCACVCASCTT